MRADRISPRLDGSGFMGFRAKGLARLAFIFAALSPGAFADTVHLKGGKTLTGIVDEIQSNKDWVWIKTNTGLVKVNRRNIERIETRQNMTAEEKRGDLLANEGDLDGALAAYARARAVDKESAELANKLADTRNRIRERDDKQFGLQFEKIDKLIKAREFESAVEMGRTLLEKADRDSVRDRVRLQIAAAYIEEAREFFNTVNYPQAERSFKQAIEVHPNGPTPYLELAEMVRQNPSRQHEAFDLYKKGIELALAEPGVIPNQKLWDCQFNYAKLHASTSKYLESIPLFWNVVEADARERGPKAMDAITRAAKPLQAQLVESKPEHESVLEILRKVRELRQQEPQINYVIGKVAYDREKFKDAIPFFAAALKNYGGDTPQNALADTLFYQAISLRADSQEREAISHLDRLLAIQPSRYEGLCERGEIYFSLAVYADALVNFQQAINVEPGNYRAYLGAGRTLRRIDRFKEAAIMYEELIKLRDDHVEYFFELGQTYAKIDRHEEAIEVYKRALDLTTNANQEDPAMRALLGEIYAHIGVSVVQIKKYNEGIEYFEKALGFRDKDPMAIAGKGEAFRELGDFTKAEGFYRQAMEVDPKNPKRPLDLGVLFHKYVKDRAKALPFYMLYYEKGGLDPQVADWIVECGGTPPRIKQAS